MMDLATGLSAMQSAGAISTETSIYLQRTLPEVTKRVEAVRRGRSQAEEAHFFRQVRTIVAPIVEYIFKQTEATLDKFVTAFAIEEVMPLGDDVWSLGLVALDETRRSLDAVCAPYRKQARTAAMGSVLWLPDWETRYDALIDALEDYSETIALGLDPDTKAEIEARLKSVRQA